MLFRVIVQYVITRSDNIFISCL